MNSTLKSLLFWMGLVVAGVLIPTLVVIALIVIPYFNINVEAEGIWLRDRRRRLTIFGIVAAALTTNGIPFVAITLLAGLQTISPSLYEAAAIDGATGWHRFRYVTLPLLTPIIAAVSASSSWALGPVSYIGITGTL